MKLRRIHRPLRRGVEHGDIGDGARRERATGQTEHARRLGAHAPDELGERKHATLDQLGVRHRERGLEPHDAERRIVERRFFFVVGVGGVVGRDAVDDAVFQRAAECGDVRRFAQRRIHLRMGVVLFARVVGQREVMRRYFGGHPNAALLRLADDGDRPACRHVTEMHVAARQLGKQHVARDHDLFGCSGNPLQAESRGHEAFVHDAAGGQRGILAMIGNGNVERAGVFQRSAHQVTGDDGLAVVRDRDGPGAHHLPELGEPLALLADRDGADRMHARQSGAPRLPHDESHCRLVVGDGIGIRHRADRREPARRGRARAARHRLFVFVAGLAQMHVQIDEPRSDDLALHVAHEGAIGRLQSAPDARDLPVLDQHISGAVQVAGGIDDVPALQQNRRRGGHSAPRFAASASSARPPASK